MNPWKFLSLGGCAIALASCALLSKGEVSLPRYFSPDLPRLTPARESKKSGVELRLGRVTSGSYIAEKIVFRQSDYEIGFYDDRLWTEKPAAYLRRVLTRVLFEEEGLRNVLSGSGPTLDVDLVSFEEVIKPKHLALVRVAFSLHDDRLVRLQQTLAVEKPIPGTEEKLVPDAVAEALGQALREAVYQVTGRVLAELSAVEETVPACDGLHPVAPTAPPGLRPE